MKLATKKESTSNRLTRRQIIKGFSAGVFVATAPWVSTSARAAGQLTVILNQGLLAKLWIDELNPKFEKETGAKLNIQQSVTGNMLAMLRTQKDNPWFRQLSSRPLCTMFSDMDGAMDPACAKAEPSEG